MTTLREAKNKLDKKQPKPTAFYEIVDQLGNIVRMPAKKPGRLVIGPGIDLSKDI